MTGGGGAWGQRESDQGEEPSCQGPPWDLKGPVIGWFVSRFSPMRWEESHLPFWTWGLIVWPWAWSARERPCPCHQSHFCAGTPVSQQLLSTWYSFCVPTPVLFCVVFLFFQFSELSSITQSVGRSIAGLPEVAQPGLVHTGSPCSECPASSAPVLRGCVIPTRATLAVSPMGSSLLPWPVHSIPLSSFLICLLALPSDSCQDWKHVLWCSKNVRGTLGPNGQGFEEHSASQSSCSFSEGHHRTHNQKNFFFFACLIFWPCLSACWDISSPTGDWTSVPSISITES